MSFVYFILSAFRYSPTILRARSPYPSSLTATYDNAINTGPQYYSVNVKKGGNNLAGALVCVAKEGEVYDYDTTDASGDVHFTIDPIFAGTMNVTVTSQDCLPHEDSVTVR